jgi:IS5 family transposase
MRSSTSSDLRGELFARSRTPSIGVAPSHPLLQLTDRLDWEQLLATVERVRRKKLKSRAGRKPHLRPLVGSVLLMATRRLTLRDAEDQIRHYAPARYLCGLTECDWTPDFTTLHDFVTLIGEKGVRLINQFTVELAVKEKLADPTVIVADTTAQEAVITHPNEMGLMTSFLAAVVAATQKVGRALPGAAAALLKSLSATLATAKKKLRSYRLFAKTKEVKSEILTAMAQLVEGAQSRLSTALESATVHKERLVKRGKVAWDKLGRLRATMGRLLPQIRSWLKTGRVAVGKIINVHIPELYAIVRGKLGKKVEFGLRWGITRLRGGFVLASLAKDRMDMQDADYAVRAVDDHIALFGKAPRGYAYDRGGHSKENVAALRNRGVKQIGIAPRGKARWTVAGRVKNRLVRERAQVEGCIGAMKSPRYGFHRPAARSMEMMGVCGQRAALGFNLNKLVREITKRDRLALVA